MFEDLKVRGEEVAYDNNFSPSQEKAWAGGRWCTFSDLI